MACSTYLPMVALSPSKHTVPSLPVSPAAVFRRSLGILQPFNLLSFTAQNQGQRKVIYTIRTCSSSSGLAASEEKMNKLEGIKLYDPKGTAVSLVGLWESRPAVVAFGRHFGCILCRKRAELLQSRKAEMDAAGVGLVLIAPGSPEQARKFVEQTSFSGEVYADPDHASYDALEFVNGVSSVVNSKSASRLAQAFIEGYRQDWKLSFEKDTMQRGGWQQGGILVAGPGINTIRYLFKDAEAGDEPKLDDVMSACCSAP